MVLGTPPGSPLSPQDGSLGSLGSIRVGSFSGKPVSPKVPQVQHVKKIAIKPVLSIVVSQMNLLVPLPVTQPALVDWLICQLSTSLSSSYFNFVICMTVQCCAWLSLSTDWTYTICLNKCLITVT